MRLKRPRWGLTQANLGAGAAADIPAHPREAAAIGAVAARERSSRGITRQQVADALGVTVDEVAALEAGAGPVVRREIEQAIASYVRALAQVQKSEPAMSGVCWRYWPWPARGINTWGAG
jgi:hypothetical protein